MQHHPLSPPQQTVATQLLLWIGFVLVALNLRLIFATLGPLLHHLALSTTTTLLVTTMPLAFLGIFSILGVKLRQWLGEERALFLALLLLCCGCSLRWFGEMALITGTLMGSAGIAVMNVIMPALARKRFAPERIGVVMGIYALMLGMGAVLGAGASLPLFQTMGGNTVGAFHSLGLWTIPALLALLFWLPQLKFGRAINTQHSGKATATVQVYKNSTAWAITLFFGLHVLNLYVFLPWMPTILMDRGAPQTNATIIFALSQASLMVGSFVMPLLAARTADHRRALTITIMLCLVGSVGLGYAPLSTAPFSALLLGFGQGGGLALGTFLFIAKSGSIDTATRVSAMAQTIGYLIAVIGPLSVGAIYHHTGQWHLPMLIITTLLLLEFAVVLPAGRNVKI